MEQKKTHKPPAHYENVIKRSTRRLFRNKMSHSASFMVIGKGKKTQQKNPTPNPKTQNPRPHFIHAFLYINGKNPFLIKICFSYQHTNVHGKKDLSSCTMIRSCS